MDASNMQGLVVLATIGMIGIAVLPIIHAIRSNDELAVIGSILIVFAAAVLSIAGGPFGGQIQGVILWAACYIVCAIADYTEGARRRQERREREAIKRAVKTAPPPGDIPRAPPRHRD